MRSKWGRLVWAAIGMIFILFLLFYVLKVNVPEQQVTYDLNHDGIMEDYHLSQGKLTISQPDVIGWQSPPEWNIRSMALDDVTGDKKPELIMLLWKRGSFERHKPLGYQQEDNRFSCHLFICQLIGNNLIPRWCSSALDQPIRDFTIRQDSAGNNYLAVEEGSYSIYCAGEPLIFGKAYSNWVWEQWGFYGIYYRCKYDKEM